MIMKQRRVLLMYATMTKNTEKIAGWFKQTFMDYGWDVTYVRVAANTDWAGLQEKLYFEDYDLICLGSPIVGGSPLQAVIKAFSFGADGALEKEVQQNLDENKKDASGPLKKPEGATWRRTKSPYPGMQCRDIYRPLGLVFSTYGGGFYGTTECSATLEILKMYLTNHDVDVIGRFACAGKETGPAGYPLGVKPKADFRPGKKNNGAEADVSDAVMYKLGDGTLAPGSYFMHYNCDGKPGIREETKAKAFSADIIEDYFMSYDGRVNLPISEILSIS